MEVYNSDYQSKMVVQYAVLYYTLTTCLDHFNVVYFFAHLSHFSTMLPTKKTNTVMASLISLLSTSVTSQWSTNLLNNSLPSVVQHDTSAPWIQDGQKIEQH